jgi:hypothetical protein
MAVALGASIGLEALHAAASGPSEDPEQMQKSLGFAKSVVGAIGANALSGALSNLTRANEEKVAAAYEAHSLAEAKRRERSQSLEAWRSSIHLALKADEPHLLEALLSAFEKRWPSKGRSSEKDLLADGADFLTDAGALFVDAIDGRAPRCAKLALDLGLGTGLPNKGGRKKFEEPPFATLARRARCEAEDKPANRNGWQALFAQAERQGVADCVAAGMSSKAACSAVELASYGRPSRAQKLTESAAKNEAERLAQATRLAAIVASRGSEADLGAAPAAKPAKSPPPRL